MDQHNIEATRNVFEAFAAEEIDRAVGLLDAAIVIEFYGTEDIPYAGVWRGREGAAAFFRAVHDSVEIHEFEAEDFIAAGDKVFVTGRLHLTAKSTGRSFRSDFAHVITLQDGRWVRFRDFMNTAVAVEAFRG